ncbi:LuxR C-terminal-related transcriptional regulator [Haloglycomyces albus]|uniref:helix-turn-helix transcriptional regulator n=1 Tax=Haloglycomyces albus TaxID=526067 RepID=UPI000A0316F6
MKICICPDHRKCLRIRRYCVSHDEEVLLWKLANGKTTEDISDSLGLSMRTVHRRIRSLCQRARCCNKFQLVFKYGMAVAEARHNAALRSMHKAQCLSIHTKAGTGRNERTCPSSCPLPA